MTSLNNIRSTFINYFEKLDHKAVESSPLVPRNDPTLMFTNAGMVQFKNVFTGIESREYKRAVTSQKCVRAGGKHNDLDNVGYTARHHTFFEMLGNFSFGDYFKDYAIPVAWDLLTKEFGLDKKRLLVTVYHDDDEAADIWKKYAGLSDDRIIKISSSDNFWSMGSTGPCGPCSEIFYDHGPEIWGGPPGSKNEDGDRFIEIWNLVFMQFEQFSDGNRENLPKPSIDTGMGLERIGAVLQGQHDNYETDTMRQIIEASASITSVEPYGDRNVHHRVIADHLRSSCFLISEGVLPSNEGRGYVLRRIMRRAMRHVHLLGQTENVMATLVPTLVQEMGHAFPELISTQNIMEETLSMEEKRFKQTLERGLFLLDSELKLLPEGATLSGAVAFKLYDTFGFPLDLTQDALREKGYSLDLEGFDSAMSEQRVKARSAWSGSGDTIDETIWFEIASKVQPTEFLGYETEFAQGQIMSIVMDGRVCDAVNKDQTAQIILNQTPFYAESGGQTSDIGTIKTETGYGVVSQVRKKEKLFVHEVTIVEGFISMSTVANLIVDNHFRSAVCSNHSATHLLHESLRNALGDHVSQRGSLNDSRRIRFDFSHSQPVSVKELINVEAAVNAYIRQNTSVSTRLMTPDEARNFGARALFGEKYGDEVRVVSMGLNTNSGLGLDGNTYSLELCGGTHVKNTGEIGFFKIISETASASGVRRLEALTGYEAVKFIAEQEITLLTIADLLKVKPTEAIGRLSSLLEEKKSMQQEVSELRKKIAFGLGRQKPDELKAVKISGIAFFGQILTDVNSKDLRGILDEYKQKIGSGVVLIAAISSSKVAFICGVTDDLTSKISAVTIVRLAAESTGGKGGGGRVDMAQAGGLEPNKTRYAIDLVKSFIESEIT